MKEVSDVVVTTKSEETGSLRDTLSCSFSDLSTHIPVSGSELGARTLRSLKRGLSRLWRRHRGNASITEYDPCYKVAYLGNVLTGWAKGEGCVEKPVSTLWRNYVSSSRPDVSMRLTVTNGGLTATTKDHGLTEYWAHRVTYCTAPVSHPRLFVWVYRHEGRRLRPELRCHAALCSKESTARRLASTLNTRLQQALLEFRKDKVSRQNARLSLANAFYENPSLPRRKILLSTGGSNYRPPLERSKSAPKLSAIEEDTVAEEIEQQRFLEELETVARSLHDQDGWRLARLLDALRRETMDENGSISSGCETASTANSEGRASSSEDSHPANETESEPQSDVSSPTDKTSPSHCSKILGPRRNSDGSPNFMTCTGSPYFQRRNSGRFCSATRKKFCRIERKKSLDDEETGEEDQEIRTNQTNLFEFEDVDDLEEVVDYRPRGDSPRRNPEIKEVSPLREGVCSRVDDLREKLALTRVSPNKDVGNVVDSSFIRLSSLDEEADSDESGYVEAPPKSPIDRTLTDGLETPAALDVTEDIHIDKKEEDSKIPVRVAPRFRKAGEATITGSNGKLEARKVFEKSSDEYRNRVHGFNSKKILVVDENLRVIERERERERGELKCPISETIKKLANASLRSSKSIQASANTCLKSLNHVQSSKSVQPQHRISSEIEGESPSLLQRKQLLAQHGVTV